MNDIYVLMMHDLLRIEQEQRRRRGPPPTRRQRRRRRRLHGPA